MRTSHLPAATGQLSSQIGPPGPPVADAGASWLIASLAIAFLLAAGVIARRRRSTTVSQLTAAIDRLGAGDFDGLHRIPEMGEWAPLAKSLRTAGDELSRRFANLETDRRQLRAVLSGMVEGVVSIDSAGYIDFVNDQAAYLLEIDAVLAVGHPFEHVVRHRAFEDAVRAAFATDGPHRDELELRGFSERRLAITAASLKGASACGVVVVVHDITELRRLERVRQEFVANVSHELKTPLAIIQLNVETLLDGAAEDPESRPTFLSEIDHQAERLHALILDLLSLARIESRSPTLEWEAVSLEALATESIARHADRAKAKGHRLEAVGDGCSDSVSAWGDRESCETILDNLVDNAMKYTPDGGAISIRWSRDDDYARLDVEDTGIGIPPEDQPHIFERFYRVDKARSRALGGTGLGLSIVKHLAAAMNGKVEVSGAPGRGSVFSVLLPLADGDSRISASSSQNLHTATL